MSKNHGVQFVSALSSFVHVLSVASEIETPIIIVLQDLVTDLDREIEEEFLLRNTRSIYIQAQFLSYVLKARVTPYRVPGGVYI